MSFELYGGIPRIRRASISITGDGYGAPVDPIRAPYIGKTNYLQIYNVGANVLQVYFTKTDFDAGVNYKTVAATSGVWEGPASLEDGQEPRSQPLVWLKAVSGATTAEIVFYHRRS